MKGTKWDPQNKCFTWSLDQNNEDKRTDEIRTMEELANMASSIISCLKFTWDSPECHGNGRMPVLDTALWLGYPEREKKVPTYIDPDAPKVLNSGTLPKIILFSFFKKPMANKRSNLARAGLPEGSKASTASAEILRRMKTVSRELPDQELDKIIREYMTELRHGGYSHQFRVNVLESARKGYANIWKLETAGNGHVNRPAETTTLKRRANRLVGKQTWFKKVRTSEPNLKHPKSPPKAESPPSPPASTIKAIKIQLKVSYSCPIPQTLN